MTELQRPPPRLLEGTGPAADCVRHALARPDLALRLPRFASLRERRMRRLRPQRSLSAFVLGAAALLGLRLLHEEEARPDILPERVLRADGRRAPASPPPASAAPKVAEPPVLAAEPVVERPPPHPRRQATSARKRSPAAPPVEVQAAPPGPPRPAPVEPNGGAKACAQLARQGASEQALECYRGLASSSGMTAELALFEQARIEGKVLHRPQLALLTLERYRQHFPQGSLRGEVMLAQIDWLLAAGDRSGALRVVNEALDSGLLRERTDELTRLRATLAPPALPGGRNLPQSDNPRLRR